MQFFQEMLQLISEVATQEKHSSKDLEVSPETSLL